MGVRKKEEDRKGLMQEEGAKREKSREMREKK